MLYRFGQFITWRRSETRADIVVGLETVGFLCGQEGDSVHYYSYMLPLARIR